MDRWAGYIVPYEIAIATCCGTQSYGLVHPYILLLLYSVQSRQSYNGGGLVSARLSTDDCQTGGRAAATRHMAEDALSHVRQPALFSSSVQGLLRLRKKNHSDWWIGSEKVRPFGLSDWWWWTEHVRDGWRNIKNAARTAGTFKLRGPKFSNPLDEFIKSN